MKIKKLLTVVLAIIAVFAITLSVSAEGSSNGWYQKPNGDWAYSVDGVDYEKGIKEIDGAYYLFENGTCWQNKIGYYYNSEDGCYYRYKADASGKLAQNQWVLQDSWYYFGEDCHAVLGWQKIGDEWYYFNRYEDGAMTVNRALVDDTGTAYAFDVNGNYAVIGNNGWQTAFGNWYYLENGEAVNGIKWIDGKAYYFSNGYMHKNTYIGTGDGNYRIKADGTLACNEWEYRSGSRYYYGADCKRVTGLVTIGGQLYYFNNNGWLQTNMVCEVDGRYLVIDENGVCTEGSNNSWLYANGDWYYVKDGSFVSNEICNIDGVDYAFTRYTLIKVQKVFNDRLVSEKGEVVTTTGWYIVGNDYVYVDEDATLHYGWLQDGSYWYYMTPYMNRATNFVSENDELCYANTDGTAYVITGDGWHDTLYGYHYIKDGKVLNNEWLFDGGYWYYMSPNVTRNGVYLIDDDWYYFDNNGHMLSGMWVTTEYGDTLFAKGDGKLAYNEWISDSGNWYYFNGTEMLKSITRTIDGVPYYINANGVAHQATNGWNYFDGNWYYVNNNYIMNDGSITIDGSDYYFRNGVMQTNSLGGYYYGADGRKVTGWVMYEGTWYYADPENSGYIYRNGIKTIDGVEYYFDDYDGKLVTNGVAVYGDEIISTNANGVVVSKTPIGDGWCYETANGKGTLKLIKDGVEYTGWYGDYYLDYNGMVADSVVYFNNSYYYVDANGLCAYNRWINLGYDWWYYAKADGTLAFDEWIFDGSNYYYFVDHYMVTGCAYIENDGLNMFGENGVWLGKATSSVDGWVYQDGNWYYYVLGERLRGRAYIDGSWYLFDYNDGKMCTNDFYGEYYYGGNGVRANYRGWVVINGNWCYFNDDYTCTYGWFKDGGNWYYQGSLEIGDDYTTGILTGYHLIVDEIYYFDANGVCCYKQTADGWVYADGEYFYISNGKLIVHEGYVAIGGSYYAFGYSGQMLKNNAYNGRLYGSDGAMITTDGWHYLDGEWYYVTGGYAATGVHIIDGVQYYFDSNGQLA